MKAATQLILMLSRDENHVLADEFRQQNAGE
jgi:hypothetical protein